MHGAVTRKLSKRSKQKEQLHPLSRKSTTHLKKVQLLPFIYYCSCYTFMLLFLTTVIPFDCGSSIGCMLDEIIHTI